MPEGMENTSAQDEGRKPGAPLDGLRPPTEKNPPVAPTVREEGAQEEDASTGQRQKKLLLILLGGGALFLLCTLIFAFYLFITLPDPSGAGQGLRFFGNLYFGFVSLLAVMSVSLLTLRMIRAGTPPEELPRFLLRPGIAATALLMLSALVFVQINRGIPLTLDIIDPQNTQGLTAPLTVTFGTDSLRTILRNQNLAPREYSWDFNGDGTMDAKTQEHEVTTIYKQKGTYVVRARITLSNGTVQTASTRIVIPNAVFSITPELPVLNEVILFDAANLVADPEKIEGIEWDFNGDGTIDQTVKTVTTEYAFPELGTFQVQATIQHLGGLRETFNRTVTILEERKQPFAFSIETEGQVRGSAPLGIVFSVQTPEEVQTRDIAWRIGTPEELRDPKRGVSKSGERISHVFQAPGEFSVIATITDSRGRIAEKSVIISVLEPLTVRDVVISGEPRPVGGKVEGVAPLDLRLSATTGTPFITFSWEQENASIVYETDGGFHALYEEEGVFPVVLIATDEQGRTQKTPLEVTVLPPRSQVSFTAVPATGVAPLTVTFDASESSVPDGRITGFAWTFGDGDTREEKPQLLGAKVTHRFENEGTYTVTVRALTEDGRSLEARKTIVVRAPTLHACIFPSRTTGGVPMGVRFDASCSTGSIQKYLWTFGDGATSEQVTGIQDHVFERAGIFTVLLEITDGKGNFDQETVTITVQSP